MKKPKLASKPDSTQRIKQSDAQSYAKFSGDFARLTWRYSDAVASHMLDLATISTEDKLLDIGTGSGLVAIKFAKLGNCKQAIGIDQSQEMLAEARAKAVVEQLGDRVVFRAMDAENLDLPDAEIDIVTGLYVLSHLPNPGKAVEESYRMLKKGGHAVFAVGAPPPLPTMDGLRASFVKVQDILLEPLGRRAISPTSLRSFLDRQRIGAQRSHAAHQDTGDVEHMFRAAGFINVQKHWFGQTFDLSLEEFWEVQSVFDSEARSRLDVLDENVVAKLRTEFLAECRAIKGRGGRLIYRTGAQIYIAER
jgi:ubiquinone/menaquinone biosynthesis C-methylase UbiE